ncbi:hypothetical protein [Bacillus mycoides]|uniref:hypothetical protein n=1 Tax=Bacillus mycoides TaxID=1405 RepID=UPI00389983CB
MHVKHKEYGYPRMKIALQEEGYFINHKKSISLNERAQHSIYYSKRSVASLKGTIPMFFPNVLNREFKDTPTK